MRKHFVVLMLMLLAIAALLPITQAQEATPDPALTAADYLVRGDEAMARRNYRGAVTEYSLAIQLEPDGIDGYLKRAQAYIAQNTLDLALADYQRAAEIAPENAAVLFALGQLQEQLGDTTAALAAYDQAIAADPGAIDAYIARVDILLAQANYEAALETASAGLENGDNPVLLRQRGFAHYHQESYRNALRDFDRAIELAPEDAQDALAYAGRALARIGSANGSFRPQALEDAERAVELDRQNAWAFYSRGIVMFAQEEYRNAISDFGQAVRLNAAFVEAYAARADAYLLQENYRQALPDMQQVITLRTEAHDYYVLSRIYNQTNGQEWRAVEAGQYALELGLPPEEIHLANFEVGFAYHSLFGFENAIAYYNLVIDDEHTSSTLLARAYTNRAIANNALGNLDLAIEDFKRSIEANPSYSVPYVRLGDMADERVDYGEALYYFRRYVELLAENEEPRHSRIEQRIRELERMGVGEIIPVTPPE